MCECNSLTQTLMSCRGAAEEEEEGESSDEGEEEGEVVGWDGSVQKKKRQSKDHSAQRAAKNKRPVWASKMHLTSDVAAVALQSPRDSEQD